MDFLMEPWPWYFSGPAIALVMFLLLMMGKRFGMSSNLRTLCTICGAGKSSKFFQYDWKAQRWNLVVVLGVIIGGFIANNYLSNDLSVSIHPEVKKDLIEFGFTDASAAFLPSKFYAAKSLESIENWIILITAGLLVGFGTRYAGGCTSGHAISGLSALQLPSLIAVVGFFIGGIIMIHLIFPLIF